jgi:peptide/nickel transport system ATP-binding protein
MADAGPLLEVKNLTISFPSPHGMVRAARNVSWSIGAGETLVILGESGSGKSVSTSAILDLIDSPPAIIGSGEIFFRGENLLSMSPHQRKSINGAKISMIFQDPLSALNPVYSIGWQISETMRVHGVQADKIDSRVIDLLRKVGIERPEQRVHDYPHQFSGGQRQRIMIASAIALEPDLLVADEPTSALDVTVQAQVLDLLKDIQRESGMSLVVITHDLSVAARIADRIIVMKDGEIVESGLAADMLSNPQHPYTKQLLAATLGQTGFSKTSDGNGATEPLVEFRQISKVYGARNSDGSGGVRAVDDISFKMAKGETLGIIGESGSGKSTMAKMLLGLEKPTSGEILVGGRDVASLSSKDQFALKRRMQFVFQDPTASLNPQMKIVDIISEPWSIHRDVLPKSQWRSNACELLERVGLSAQFADRYPHQFSGGQRQRIAIARSLALRPDIIVCDEALSALDASVRGQIIDLLKELRRELGLSYVFIGHDLSVVRNFATRVVIMLRGKIVEQGDVETIFTQPSHEYTQKLLAASFLETA